MTVDEAKLYTDPARREVDMVFQFEHVQVDHGETRWDVRPLRLRDLKAVLGRWQAGLAEVGWNSLYWNNHDQPRVVSRFGDDGEHRVRSAKMLGTVLHLHRGTPYVYQGEELGMTNAPFASIDDYRDIQSLNHYAEAVSTGADPETALAMLRVSSRDNARTPMQWDDTENAGFTTGTPWIAVNPNYKEINARAEIADEDSVFHHYRRLIELRHTEPAVVHGDFHMLLADHNQVYAFTDATAAPSYSSSPTSPESPLPSKSPTPTAGKAPSSYLPTTRWTPQRTFSALRSGHGRRASTEWARSDE